MQNAFITEKGDAIGSFKAIGYEMAQTQSFKYVDKVTGTTNETVALPSASTQMWDAEALVGLNDCDKGSHWGLFGKSVTNGSGLDYTVGIKDKGAAADGTVDADCSVLTASFEQLGINN